jgi:hypothetical protein
MIGVMYDVKGGGYDIPKKLIASGFMGASTSPTLAFSTS